MARLGFAQLNLLLGGQMHLGGGGGLAEVERLQPAGQAGVVLKAAGVEGPETKCAQLLTGMKNVIELPGWGVAGDLGQLDFPGPDGRRGGGEGELNLGRVGGRVAHVHVD